MKTNYTAKELIENGDIVSISRDDTTLIIKCYIEELDLTITISEYNYMADEMKGKGNFDDEDLEELAYNFDTYGYDAHYIEEALKNDIENKKVKASKRISYIDKETISISK